MKVCPVCEGFTSSRLKRCGTCEVPMVDLVELAWVRRDEGGVASSPWIGHLVGGKYRITGVLGRGGMGTVYRAVHELSLSPAAVKVLHARFAGDARYRDQLMAEARRASRVRGDHIAQVLDVGETQEGSIYIAMELVEGETLQAFLARESVMKPAQVLTLLDLALHALEEMGRAGLVHRDISPSNLMLTRRGRAASLKILDLGIAQIPEEGDPDKGGGLWVNPPYTAPEVLEGNPGTQLSDLYSLGAVAYQALTGKLPHGGETTHERVRAVIEDAPAQMDVPRGTPRRLGLLIRRLMNRDPAARPQSANEVLERIRAIRRPRRPVQRAVSILIFLAGVVLLTLSMTRRPEATLLARQDSIRLSSRLPRENTQPQYLELEALQEQTFEAHGIGPGDLVLDCFYEDGSSGTYELEGRRKGRDLSFGIEEDAEWRRFYQAVSTKGGPVRMSFRREGRSLAHARLFVDREAPRLADARLEGAGGKPWLLRDSVFVARIQEDGPSVQVRFQLLNARSEPLHEFTKEVTGSRLLSVPLGLRFRDRPGTASGDPALLKVELVDQAGRKSDLWSRYLEHVDLSLPEITAAESAEGSLNLLLSGERGEILLRLSSDVRPNDISKVWVQVETGRGEPLRRLMPVEVEAGKIRVQLMLPDLADLEKVITEFQLLDRLGNTSKVFHQTFDVRVLDLQSRFRSRPTGAGKQDPFLFTPDGNMLLLARPPFSLIYECNPGYEPRLLTRDLPAGVTQVHKEGICTVSLPASLPPQATFDLHFQHRNVKTDRLLVRGRTLNVRLLPKAPSLSRRRDWSSGGMWTQQLVKAGFFEAKTNDEFRMLLGTSLGLELPEDSGAKAWLWRDGPKGWSRIRKLASASPLVLLDRGRNHFALEAVDDLGRQLVDLQRLEDKVMVGKSRLLPFVDFHHDSREPRGHDVLIEYGHPVRMSLDFPQAFEPGTSVRLTPSWQAAGAEPPVNLELQPTKEGGSRGTVRVEFATVRHWCGLEGVSKTEFGKRAAIVRRFRLETPAGDNPDLEIRFQPTRSLLRVQDLSEMARSRKRVAPSRQKMIPFLGADELTLGLERNRHRDLPGTLRVDQTISVTGLDDFFLAQTEVSRRDYLEFQNRVLAGKVDDELVGLLGHAEDPMGAARFTKKGLAPFPGHFPGLSLDALAQADGDRPVTGVDYYQASAYCRWLSLQTFGEPDLLRLPFSAELVLAALNRFPSDERQQHLNGLHVPGQKWKGGVEEAWGLWRRLARGELGLRPQHWPLKMRELETVGDYCVGLIAIDAAEGDSRCYGVDFGVREWVEDLPFEVDTKALGAVTILIGNHSEHLQLTRNRREGRKRAGLSPEVIRLGVIRGLSFAEPAFRGRDPLSLGYLRVPDPKGKPANFGDAALLGVRRTENAKRDGILSGDRKNPFLGVVGFRVAGTRKFMEQARMGTQ